MTKFLLLSIKKYISSYTGLSLLSWQRIIISFISTLSSGILFFLTYYFVKILHINIATAGIIISFYGIGTIIGGILGGKLSDYIAPINISIISLIIKAVVVLILIKIQSVSFLMTDLFLLGLSSYAFKTSNNIWVLNECAESKKVKLKAINILYVATNLGIGISAIIINFFINFWI